jgi:hypothetical protein
MTQPMHKERSNNNNNDTDSTLGWREVFDNFTQFALVVCTVAQRFSQLELNTISGLKGRLAQMRACRATERITQITLNSNSQVRQYLVQQVGSCRQCGKRRHTLPQADFWSTGASWPLASAAASTSARPQVQSLHAFILPPSPTSQSSVPPGVA